MKIGVDGYPLSFSTTGVGNYLLLLLEGLLEVRKKDLFYLYAPQKSPLLEKLARHPNIRLRLSPFLSFSEALWSQTTLPLQMAKDDLTLFWGATQSLPLLLNKRVKSLLTIHDFAYRLYPATLSNGRKWYLKLGASRFYHKANSLIVNSLATGEKLQQLYHLQYDLHLPPPVRFPPTLNSKKEYAIVVATLEPRKNLSSLLESYEHFLIHYPNKNPLPLYIVGKRGWKCEELEAELDRLQKHYPEMIHYLGYVSDNALKTLIAEAQILLLCSIYEGYGMPLAEARTLGTPVIAWDQPEMREAAEGDGIFIKKLEEALPFLQKGAMRKVAPLSYPTALQLAERFSQAIDHLMQQL